MSREIKFSYIQQHDETGRFAESYLTLNQIEGMSPGIQYKGYTLVVRRQFTGLHDKNGREIYEGDVVESSGLIFPITVDDFHGYRFMFGKDQLNKATAVYGEVIGNIYEDPELCKAGEG